MNSLHPADTGKKRILAAAGLLLAVFAAAAMTALKTAQLLLFHNEATGLLERGPLPDGLNWAGPAGVLVILLAGLLLLPFLWDRRHGETGQASTAEGIAAFLAGLFFLAQGVSDFLTGFGSGTALSAFLGMLVTLFSVITGAALLAAAYRMVSAGKQPAFGLLLCPVLWGILLVIHLLLSAPETVSLESSVAKTMTACLALLYFYIVLREICVPGGKSGKLLRYVGAVTPGILLGMSLPYLIAWACGVRDAYPDTPYLAFLGIAVFAAARLARPASRTRRPEGEEPAESEETEPPVPEE